MKRIPQAIITGCALWSWLVFLCYLSYRWEAWLPSNVQVSIVFIGILLPVFIALSVVTFQMDNT